MENIGHRSLVSIQLYLYLNFVSSDNNKNSENNSIADDKVTEWNKSTYTWHQYLKIATIKASENAQIDIV